MKNKIEVLVSEEQKQALKDIEKGLELILKAEKILGIEHVIYSKKIKSNDIQKK